MPYQEPKKPRLSVAICGGGIAGLLLAVGLSKYDDIQVNVYEAAERFKEVGAGVTIWGRALKILIRMGLDHDMRVAEGVPTDGLHDTSIYFHRAYFLDVLVKHLPPGIAHFRKRLVRYSKLESGAVELDFADGTSATCDVLLGCDGIRSAARRQMFETEATLRNDPELLQYIEPVWSGYIAYRTLVPAELLTSEDGGKHSSLLSPMLYVGRGKRIITYPVAGGSMCNFAGIISGDIKSDEKKFDGPWMTECEAQEIVDCFADWEPKVTDMCKLIQLQRPMKWALHEVRKLPFSVNGNVALVGDAAHAMVPFQASGAAQAIEDAYVLVGLLSHQSTTPANVAGALQAYERVRLPVAQLVMERSTASGRLSGSVAEYEGDYVKLGKEMEKLWDWINDEDPLVELERAVRWCYPDDVSLGIA
ncbi:hypothetical protein EIP86_004955 [Pleurotus ostreatoroseus]|nr:hypothetical protein EIP86_004955 [Pleurotus ostreatoroseus]